MIWRFFNVLAIVVLIGTASYAYSIKYDSAYQLEQAAKLKSRIQRERDAIAVLRAEWQLLNRPERLQRLTDKHLDLQPLNIQQLARLSDIAPKAERGDELGKKLEAMGLKDMGLKDMGLKDLGFEGPKETGSIVPAGQPLKNQPLKKSASGKP